MGFFRDSSSSSTSDNNGFVRHEIKTFQRKGDLVRSEFERLNPDGTVTKTIAYGDTKEGLRYKTYQMGVDGVVREVPTEFAPPRAITQQPPQRAPEPRPEPRKTFAFVVEPKSNPAPPQQYQDMSGSWRVKPISMNQQRTIEQPRPQSQSAPQQKELPWWYEPLKEAFNDVVKEQQLKSERPPPPPPAPVPESYSDRKLSKRIFDLFSDDFVSLKNPKPCFPKLPSFSDSFDRLEDSLFGDIFTPLLEDF